MAVVVNNPQPEQTSPNSNFPFGIIIALVLVVLVVFLVIYMIPRLGNGLGKTQINIPNKFDVNVHQTK